MEDGRWMKGEERFRFLRGILIKTNKKLTMGNRFKKNKPFKHYQGIEKPTNDKRNFFIEEIADDPYSFKMTDQGSGLSLILKHAEGKTFEEMTDLDKYIVAEYFSKIVSGQLDFEKKGLETLLS